MKRIVTIFFLLYICSSSTAQTITEELILQQFHSGNEIFDFDIDSSGSKIVSVGDDKNILFYDLQTRLIYNRIKLKDNVSCKHLRVDNKNKRVVTLQNNSLVYYDLVSGENKFTIPLKPILDSLKLEGLDDAFFETNVTGKTLVLVAKSLDKTSFLPSEAHILVFSLAEGKFIGKSPGISIASDQLNSVMIYENNLWVLTSRQLLNINLEKNKLNKSWQATDQTETLASIHSASNYLWILSNKKLYLVNKENFAITKEFPQELGANGMLMQNHPFAVDANGKAYLFHAQTEKLEIYSKEGKIDSHNSPKAYLPKRLKAVDAKKYLVYVVKNNLVILDNISYKTLLTLNSATSEIKNWKFFKPGIAYAVSERKEAFIQADFTRGFITRQNFADKQFYYQAELIDLPKSGLKVASNGLYVKFLDAKDNQLKFGIAVPQLRFISIDDPKLNFGSSKGNTNIFFSEDEKLMICAKNLSCAILVWDIENKKLLREINLKPKNKPDNGKTQIVKHISFHAKEKLIYVETEDNYSGNNESLVIDALSGKILFQEHTKFSNGIKSNFFPTQRKVFFPGELYGETRILDINNKTFETLPFAIQNPQISKNELYAYFISGDSVYSYNLTTKKRKSIGSHTNVDEIFLDTESNLLLSYSNDNITKIWDAETASLKCTFFINIPDSKDEDPTYLFISPENYYMGGGNYSQFVALKKDGVMLPFEQFDRIYNRPDKLLSSLGKTNPELLGQLETISTKRTKKQTNNFIQGFKAIILNKENYALQNAVNETTINFNAIGSKSKLTTYQIWINGVAQFQGKGKDAKPNSNDKWAETIKLTEKNNRIELAFWNEEGKESMYDFFVTELANEIPKPSLWLVSIGASEYSQSEFNLKYAAKDANNIAEFFKGANAFQKTNTLVLNNSQVTKEGLLKVKTFLSAVAEQDVVLLFYAGHGLLDNKQNYFLASHDMDFQKPELNGLAIEEFEKILLGIKARKKLFIIDACHSGLLEDAELIIPEKSTNSENVNLTGRGIQVNKNTNKTIDAELLQSIFLNSNASEGITIIAAAGGAELAYEDPQYQNGLFTFSLLEGIKSMKADLNKDGEIALSELKKYVERRVLLLSQGKQRPTNRKWNSYADFYIWQ